ncbi:MAG TPA: NADH-quinone oxidoreductase subunit N [Armatimonadota bacterium]|nr:NADH-quinone oxidoreductase subunit N [Armatimonadota bacterium]
MKQEYLYIVQSFAPEIVLVLLALLVWAADLLLPKQNARKILAIFAAFGSLCAAGLAAMHWIAADGIMPAFVQQALGNNPMTSAGQVLGHPGVAVWWLFANDKFADAFKIIFALAAFLVLLISVRFPVEKYRGEFIGLLLFSAVGLMTMVNSRDLVVLFLGLELTSICLYALVAWHKSDARSAEAGTKYLLLGSLASAFFIYGASLLFVKYGSTNLSVLAQISPFTTPLALSGLLMLLIGFGFKIAAAPFHLWAPDVYQGAPTAVSAFLSTASKAAGFAVIIRVLGMGFPAFSSQWALLIALMAGLSLLIGNLVAVHQNNVKRMLAYSGIAQAGYLLIGVVALGMAQAHHMDPQLGISAVILYLFLYMVGNIGAFAITGIVEKETGHGEMTAFAGLRTRAPLLAFAMILLLLSLGGIPLLAGFAGKWFLFLSGIMQGQYALVLLAALLSVVSIYYYLLVVKQMYIKPAEEGATTIRVGGAASFGLFLIVALTLVIGCYPWPFLSLAQQTAQALLGM